MNKFDYRALRGLVSAFFADDFIKRQKKNPSSFRGKKFGENKIGSKVTQLKVTQINFPTRRGNSILEFFAIGTRFSDYLWEFFWFLHLKRSKKSDKLRKCKEIYSGASNSSAGSKSKPLKGNFENTENREKFKSRQ